MYNEFQSFVRKQFPVQAARVTPLNIEELAEFCGGRLMHDGEKDGQFSRDYIKVRVAFPLNEEQTKARVGDWLVKQGRNFKVYKDRAFRNTFETKDGTPVPQQEIEQVATQEPSVSSENRPSPAAMPKKIVHTEPASTPDEIDQAKLEAQIETETFQESEPPHAPPSENVVDSDPEAVPSEETPSVEESKPITLDELNDQQGDPRSTQEIMAE